VVGECAVPRPRANGGAAGPDALAFDAAAEEEGVAPEPDAGVDQGEAGDDRDTEHQPAEDELRRAHRGRSGPTEELQPDDGARDPQDHADQGDEHHAGVRLAAALIARQEDRRQ
jgi:hypothetical protein